MSVLTLEGVSRSFGGVLAVDDVTFDVEEGARHVIFGPNGAGKTTLFRTISGEIRATAGRIHALGCDVTRLPSWRRSRLGMARTFQVTNLFFDLTVEDNVRLACQADDRSRLFPLRPRRKALNVTERVHEVLEAEGLAPIADKIVRTASYGEQRLLEIALVVARRPRLLMLDEPTSGVPSADGGKVMERVARMPEDVTIVFIEHDLDIAFRYATTATVLGDGSLVAHGRLADVRADPAVQALYLGGGHADE